MIIFNKLDNYFVVSADSQTFLGFEITANFRDTSPLIWKLRIFCKDGDNDNGDDFFCYKQKLHNTK